MRIWLNKRKGRLLMLMLMMYDCSKSLTYYGKNNRNNHRPMPTTFNRMFRPLFRQFALCFTIWKCYTLNIRWVSKRDMNWRGAIYIASLFDWNLALHFFSFKQFMSFQSRRCQTHYSRRDKDRFWIYDSRT